MGLYYFFIEGQISLHKQIEKVSTLLLNIFVIAFNAGNLTKTYCTKSK